MRGNSIFTTRIARSDATMYTIVCNPVGLLNIAIVLKYVGCNKAWVASLSLKLHFSLAVMLSK